MPKRVTVYKEDLQEYINLVVEALGKHTADVKEFTSKLDPPYPLMKLEDAEAHYHVASLAMVIYSCMQKFMDDIRSMKHEVIESCYEEYKLLPSRNYRDPDGKLIAGDSQPGIEDTTFTDDMLSLSNNIAEYIELHDIKVPYIRRAGVTSDKITSSLAIIYTGRILKKRKQEQKEASSDNTD